jgi:hypothetical protein
MRIRFQRGVGVGLGEMFLLVIVSDWLQVSVCD